MSGKLVPITLLFALGFHPAAVADRDVGVTAGQQGVVVIKTPPQILTRQKLPNFVGISAQTAGAKGLSMNLVIIPPGASAEPHYHKGFESGVYVLEGEGIRPPE